MRKLEPGRLVIASHNAGKVREIRALVAPFGIEPVSAADLDLPEPEETGTTFAANALLKARSAADLSGLPALADDSGLCVEALGGEPGVYTANWAEVSGSNSANRDWMHAMRRVEDRLEALGSDTSRAAHFVCTLAVAWPDGSDALFEGRVDGSLVWPPRGDRGFGYDPMFVPEGYDETFGEMNPDAKHAISHRAHAFAKLVAAVLLTATDALPLALYIHWPFCVSKCPYCDFNSHVRASVDQDAWLAALLADLAHEAALTQGRALGSIFFGGGTPSLMPPATVAALIDAASRHWRADDAIEITLEANPSSVEAARFADLAAAGVNRVSLGLQALDDDALAFLGRAHSVAEGLAALEIAQRAFARVSFDLIYARPDQTPERWHHELGRAIAFGTEHLSLYQLTVEPGTRFHTLVEQGTLVPLDADLGADLFEATRSITAAAGLPAYEVSNHARPGAESRHNLTYWRYGDYVGVGPGAHGRRGGLATVRHRKPENWLGAVARHGHGCQVEEVLTPHEQAREALVMGLRLREGIDLARVERRSGVAPVDLAAVSRLARHGLVEHADARLRLTEAGVSVLDAVLVEIAA